MRSECRGRCQCCNICSVCSTLDWPYSTANRISSDFIGCMSTIQFYCASVVCYETRTIHETWLFITTYAQRPGNLEIVANIQQLSIIRYYILLRFVRYLSPLFSPSGFAFVNGMEKQMKSIQFNWKTFVFRNLLYFHHLFLLRSCFLPFRYLNAYWLHMIYRSHLHFRADSWGYLFLFLSISLSVSFNLLPLFSLSISLSSALPFSIAVFLLPFSHFYTPRLRLMIFKHTLNPIWINHFDILCIRGAFKAGASGWRWMWDGYHQL